MEVVKQIVRVVSYRCDPRYEIMNAIVKAGRGESCPEPTVRLNRNWDWFRVRPAEVQPVPTLPCEVDIEALEYRVWRLERGFRYHTRSPYFVAHGP